jgi:hypothetical protein
MRRLLFHFLPQVLNGVEVWRIGWQLLNRQAIRVGLETWLHRLAGVIPRSILDHHHRLLRLRQDLEQKRCLALRVQATRLGWIETLPAEIVNETKALVALAFAAGWNLGLLAFKRPGLTQRAPLINTGLIAKEQERFLLPCLLSNLGPPQ